MTLNIKKPHIKLLFGFTKVLTKKTKAYKLVVGNSGSSITANKTNLEKATYFLSPMSCSISKLKSHMLFTF